MRRRIRVLVGKPGLDGHDRGAKVVAAALRDAGMEVIYTGLHQTPEQVVEAAVQEDVDVVALSILSGAHMTLFPEVLSLMNKRGIGDRLLTGGGIIPSEDMRTLKGMGVGSLFGPGSSTQDIAVYIRDWFAHEHGAGAAGPAKSGAAAKAKQTAKPRARGAAAAKRKKPAAPRAAKKKPARAPASASRKATGRKKPARAGAKSRATSTRKTAPRRTASTRRGR